MHYLSSYIIVISIPFLFLLTEYYCFIYVFITYSASSPFANFSGLSRNVRSVVRKTFLLRGALVAGACNPNIRRKNVGIKISRQNIVRKTEHKKHLCSRRFCCNICMLIFCNYCVKALFCFENSTVPLSRFMQKILDYFSLICQYCHINLCILLTERTFREFFLYPTSPSLSICLMCSFGLVFTYLLVVLMELCPRTSASFAMSFFTL